VLNPEKADPSSGVVEALDAVERDAQRVAGLAKRGLDLINTSAYSSHFYEEAGDVISAVAPAIASLTQSVSEARQASLAREVREAVNEAVRKAYSKPVEDLSGYRTVVRKDERTHDDDRTPERALPQKSEKGPDQATHGPNNMHYNTPPGGGGIPRVRMPSLPGEQYGVPYKNTPLLTRRTDETSNSTGNDAKRAAWDAVQKAVGRVLG